MVGVVEQPRRRATYEDLIAVPEHLIAEIIDGELVTSPRPAPPHALATSAIGALLFNHFNRPPGSADGGGGWWILDEPELHLGDDVLVPDLAGWRRERMPALPEKASPTSGSSSHCCALSRSTSSKAAAGRSSGRTAAKRRSRPRPSLRPVPTFDAGGATLDDGCRFGAS
jgi:hypothetical protein